MSEVYLWVGLAVTNLLLGALWAATWFFGKHVFNRITRVYSLEVVWYWLNRLEKEGLRTFEKARQESLRDQV